MSFPRAPAVGAFALLTAPVVDPPPLAGDAGGTEMGNDGEPTLSVHVGSGPLDVNVPPSGASSAAAPPGGGAGGGDNPFFGKI